MYNRVKKYEGKKSVLMLFVNANETVISASEQEEKLRKSLEHLSQIQGQTAIFASDLELNKKLISLISTKNIQVRSYEDADRLIPQIHEDIRKQVAQK